MTKEAPARTIVVKTRRSPTHIPRRALRSAGVQEGITVYAQEVYPYLQSYSEKHACEVTTLAHQFMLHANRKIVTKKDVAAAMKQLNVPVHA